MSVNFCHLHRLCEIEILIIADSKGNNSVDKSNFILQIEEHIEEITTTYENSDDDVNETINYNGAIPFPESGRTIWTGM